MNVSSPMMPPVEPDRVRDGRRSYDLVAEIARVALKRVQSGLAEVGLSVAAYNVLRVLREQQNKNMTKANVRAHLNVEGATLSAIVMRMERDGLVWRDKSLQYKHVVFLKPTERGSDLAQRADQTVPMLSTSPMGSLTTSAAGLSALDRILSILPWAVDMNRRASAQQGSCMDISAAVGEGIG